MAVSMVWPTLSMHHHEERISQQKAPTSCPIYICPKEPLRSISYEDNDVPAMPSTARQAANLHSLPSEILLQITSYLSHPSLVSLKLTSRFLHNTTASLPRPRPQELSLCGRVALRRYLAERSDHAAGKRWCIACQMLQPKKFFHRPLSVPLCNWHDGWMMCPRTPKDLKPEFAAKLQQIAQARTSPCWIPVRRLLCSGCLQVQDWGGTSVSSATSSSSSSKPSNKNVKNRDHCSCSCPDCGKFEVLCLFRLAPLSTSETRRLHSNVDKNVDIADEPRTWDWPREFKGELTVMEGHGKDPRHLHRRRAPVIFCEEDETMSARKIASETYTSVKYLLEGKGR